MKKGFLVFVVLLVFGFAVTSWGQCPEDPYDRGECDTLHIIPWDADVQTLQAAAGGPYRVRVPLRVSCDITDPLIDSISGFILPFCFTHSREELSCELPADSNNIFLYPFPNLDESIFRHMGTAAEDKNWMMTLSEDFVSGRAWDQIILDLTTDPDVFWLAMFPAGGQDQLFISGNRILLVTMDFLLEDTMTVCIDTCFWPPQSRLAFITSDATTKIPRPGEYETTFKTCFSANPNDVKEIEETGDNKPTEFSLSQNYPNPFNPATNFRFTLAKTSQVKIEIYNIVGQRVRTLVDEEMRPGVYVADWDSKDDKGNSVSSGIYFYRMTAGDFSDMKKMLLVK
jgi:hypothetical protein